ncbi:MAG: hypothetical protein ACK4N5_12250, partial [Myxococcales bacterium]
RCTGTFNGKAIDWPVHDAWTGLGTTFEEDWMNLLYAADESGELHLQVILDLKPGVTASPAAPRSLIWELEEDTSPLPDNPLVSGFQVTGDSRLLDGFVTRRRVLTFEQLDEEHSRGTIDFALAGGEQVSCTFAVGRETPFLSGGSSSENRKSLPCGHGCKL